jgi:hypothetical protein
MDHMNMNDAWKSTISICNIDVPSKCVKCVYIMSYAFRCKNRMCTPKIDECHTYMCMCYVYDNVCICTTMGLHMISMDFEHKKCKYLIWPFENLDKFSIHFLIYFWMWILAPCACVGLMNMTKCWQDLFIWISYKFT